MPAQAGVTREAAAAAREVIRDKSAARAKMGKETLAGVAQPTGAAVAAVVLERLEKPTQAETRGGMAVTALIYRTGSTAWHWEILVGLRAAAVVRDFLKQLEGLADRVAADRAAKTGKIGTQAV